VSVDGWRLARASDADLVTAVLGEAFADDPLWGIWALPDIAETADRATALRAHWAPFVAAGMKYDGVIMSPGGEAVAVWIPPGVPEMDEADEAALTAGTQALFGDRAPLLFELYEMFAGARPADPPNWCLSLLATVPEHRGKGHGMQLVSDFLVRVDAEGAPAYLESTNPGNLARYGRAGFARHGEFTAPGGPTVTTMWRPARRS
jgi:GNAT superfamily N-acetyltransferase